MSVIKDVEEDPILMAALRTRDLPPDGRAHKLRFQQYANKGEALTLLRDDANHLANLIGATQDRIWQAVDYDNEDEVSAAKKLVNELQDEKEEHLRLLRATYWFRTYWMAFRDQYGAEQADFHTIAEAEAFMRNAPTQIESRYGDFFALVLAAIEANWFAELVN